MKEIKRDNIYLGIREQTYFNDYFFEYEVYRYFTLVEKTDYIIKSDNLSLTLYEDIETAEKLYLTSDREVFNSLDSDYFSSFISLNEFLKILDSLGIENEEKLNIYLNYLYLVRKMNMKNRFSKNQVLELRDLLQKLLYDCITQIKIEEAKEEEQAKVKAQVLDIRPYLK